MADDKAKYTPGPWKWERIKKGPRGGGGGIMIWLGPLFPLFLPDTAQMESNANLIVAAPELLEALKEILAITDRDHAVWEKARAVVAKAEGRNA